MGLQFWFEFASTYSYPAAMRIESLAERTGVHVQYVPFLLGPIFAAQGWNNSPFNLYPAKGRYMWREMERICEREGLPWHKPSIFPQNGLQAARLATAAAEEAWLPELVRRIYLANFAHQRDISDLEVLCDALAGLVEAPREWLDRLALPETKAKLRANTDLALERGIFGAPSFWVDGELYWGHDRMDEAFEHASKR